MFISIVVYEFIYIWNVKVYCLKGIVLYDYININYVKILWIVEGLISYFEDYLMVCFGIEIIDEFFGMLMKMINCYL